MSLKNPRKRITARVSDNVRVTLEQAAELLGATVNQFVVQDGLSGGATGDRAGIGDPAFAERCAQGSFPA